MGSTGGDALRDSLRADLAAGFDRWGELFRHGLTLMRDVATYDQTPTRSSSPTP